MQHTTFLSASEASGPKAKRWWVTSKISSSLSLKTYFGERGWNKSHLHHLTKELKSNSLSCLLLISFFCNLPDFFFMPEIYLILAPLPKGPLFNSGAKGIPSTHAFHYCLNFFSADHDCTSTCQQSLLRREIQFFLRRKIIGYFISPCSSYNTKMFNAFSRWLIFLNVFQILACTSQHFHFQHPKQNR